MSFIFLKKFLSIFVFLFFFIQGAIADTSFVSCSEHFYQQTTPSYTNAQVIKEIQNKAYPLCFNGFAVMYSGRSRTPLWSAEYLTKERIYQADDMPREDSFHEEGRVTNVDRATLESYSGSGYDRGHLAPNSDMANSQQQYDSFSLANIVPQSPYLNRNTWKQVESATRYLTKIYDEAYVITGVIFDDDPEKIEKSVSVPSHLFKAVYLPEIQQAGVYYSPNDESGRVELMSLQEFANESGIVLMPTLDSLITTKTANLPMPFEAFGKLSDEPYVEQDNTHQNNTTVDSGVLRGTDAGLSLSWIMDWLSELVGWIRQQIQP